MPKTLYRRVVELFPLACAVSWQLFLGLGVAYLLGADGALGSLALVFGALGFLGMLIDPLDDTRSAR